MPTKPEQDRKDLRALAANARPLVERLDTLFPNRCASLTDTDRQVWWNAGARSVVDLLLTLIREADTRGNVLEG